MSAQERKKKKRKKKRYLLKFILLILVGVGIFFFLHSALFDIDTISVENNTYYTDEQIIEISQLEIGTNSFEMKKNAMHDTLMQDPYIKYVKISRALPTGVSIYVEERKEVAVVPYHDSTVVLDIDGVALRETSADPNLIYLEGLTVKEVVLGHTIVVEENSSLSSALNIIKAMEENELFFKKINISNVMAKVYIYDKLLCEAEPEMLIGNMSTLKAVLSDLYTQDIKRGTIKLGSDGYSFFSPEIE